MSTPPPPGVRISLNIRVAVNSQISRADQWSRDDIHDYPIFLEYVDDHKFGEGIVADEVEPPPQQPDQVGEGGDPATMTPFSKNLLRGNLCAFIPGYLNQRQYAKISVESVVRFMPGMRVAVAADPSEIAEYQE